MGSEEDGGDDSTKAEVGEEERAKLRERISAIEADLEKAIHEENFDKAGELTDPQLLQGIIIVHNNM